MSSSFYRPVKQGLVAVTATAPGQLIAYQRAGCGTTDGAQGAAKQHIAHGTAGNSSSAYAYLLTAGAMGAAAQCQSTGECDSQSQGLAIARSDLVHARIPLVVLIMESGLHLAHFSETEGRETQDLLASGAMSLPCMHDLL